MRSNLPKRDDLRDFFSKAALRKAEDYQLQRRVTALGASDDLTNITARVRGSERMPYGVDIVLTFDGDELIDVDGDCSCPMAYNCKHVAATLLEAFGGAASNTTPRLPLRTSGGKATLAPPVLTGEITAWLEKIGDALRGNDFPAELNQRLLYSVQAHVREGRMPHLAASLLSVRLRKDGNFSNQVSRPAVSSNSLTALPAYLREADIDILAGLSGEIRTYSQYDVRLIRPVALLHQIVNTGRAYWGDHNRPPLRWGETRQGRIEWRRSSQAGIAPHLIVEHAIALNSEPPVYVDEAAGMVGPVETGLPARLAHRLLSAPIIPPSQAAEVARRLGQKLPAIHHDLLPAAPTAAVKIDQDPTPLVRLMLGKPSTSGYGYYYGPSTPVPLAQPSFRYGPVEIELSEKAASVESFHDGQIYLVQRSRVREREALKRLAELGFIEARSAHPFLDARHRHGLELRKPGDWFRFLAVSVRDLQAEGFEIRIDDDFPYRLAESSDVFDAEFESSGIDWFELGLGIEIDGERRDLTSIVATLVSTPGFAPGDIKLLAEAGDRFYLPLPDGRHVSLAADRFLPLVLALHSLNLQGAVAGKSGKIRLSRTDIVPLLGLENEAFAFRGAENLRRLAGLLQARGLAAPPMPAGFKATLRPYQAHGVAWLDLLRESGLGGVLADDMGLGKTVQVLALLALEKARGSMTGPVLVVAPTSLMTNWFNEARRFAPELRVLVLHGSLRKQSFAVIADHDLVLTTYPLIARDHEVLLSRDWHIAVLDEAQTIKNPNAATTRWLRGINARHRFCLTGTPMENHLGELWSIMTFANPGHLGDKAAFARQWRGADRKTRRQGPCGSVGATRQAVPAAADQGGGGSRTAAQERNRRERGAGRQSARPLRFHPLVDVREGASGDQRTRPGQEPHHRSRSLAENAPGLLPPCASQAR